MNRIRRLSAFTAFALFIGAASFAGIPTATADPVCGTPGTPPCAGPGPLTPEQQCALFAWRTWTPCNWMGMQVPAGTPGSMG
ncbi:MAG TPA: hypothetical protein VGI68_01065 [Mycobacterium sp.]|jgi:hypothetical protein